MSTGRAVKCFLMRVSFDSCVCFETDRNDASSVMSLMHNSIDLLHLLHELVCECKHLNKVLWSCPYSSVPKCCNYCADALSKLSHQLKGIHSMLCPCLFFIFFYFFMFVPGTKENTHHTTQILKHNFILFHTKK